MAHEKKISLIIATYNRGEQLLRTLMSVAGQTLDRELWELIVINNNSTDNTADVFEQFAAEHPEVDASIVFEPRQGVSHARNRGIKESRGEIIVSVDDDEEIVADFLQEYLYFFESAPMAMAAGGRIVARYDSPKPKWLSPLTERPIAGTLDLGDEIIEFPKRKFFGAGNMGIRREMFDKYGLLDTSLGRTGTTLMGGEEKDLFMRYRNAGAKMYYLPDAIIYHLIPEHRLTKEYFTRLCYLIGRSERVRTLNESKGAYRRRLASEAVKWCGAFVFAAGYTIVLQPAKGWYLLLMRVKITKGLLKNKQEI